MAPLAPGLFSTTPGWPRYSGNLEAMARPTMSEDPPAGNGMTTRIGFEGYAWAWTDPTAAQSARLARKRFISRFRLVGEGGKFTMAPSPGGPPMLARLLLLSFALAALPAAAQTYPSKPIRLVVPYAAGG